jgi:hypothetical protein
MAFEKKIQVAYLKFVGQKEATGVEKVAKAC